MPSVQPQSRSIQPKQRQHAFFNSHHATVRLTAFTSVAHWEAMVRRSPCGVNQQSRWRGRPHSFMLIPRNWRPKTNRPKPRVCGWRGWPRSAALRTTSKRRCATTARRAPPRSRISWTWCGNSSNGKGLTTRRCGQARSMTMWDWEPGSLVRSTGSRLQMSAAFPLGRCYSPPHQRMRSRNVVSRRELERSRCHRSLTFPITCGHSG